MKTFLGDIGVKTSLKTQNISSTYKIKPEWPRNKFFKNESLQTSLCEYIVLRKTIFILELITSHF